jgi:hypothetical protein
MNARETISGYVPPADSEYASNISSNFIAGTHYRSALNNFGGPLSIIMG